MVKLIHKERVAEGSTRKFLDGRRNDVPLRKGMVAKFRESHHMVAKLFAAGLRGTEVAAKTGYSESTIAHFHNDPAFQELLSKYRDLDTQLFLEGRDEFYSLATKNMIQAERQLSDKMDEIDEEGEFLPTRELVSIVADRADRFGYGKRETKFNVNVDFADALQRAIKRSGKVVDGNEGLGGMKLLAQSEGPCRVPNSDMKPSLAPEDQNPQGCQEAGQLEAVGTSQHLHAASPSEGSAGGRLLPQRSVEASQRGVVLPGDVEPQPLRRRRLLA